MLAVGVGHGDWLRAGADERVPATAASGRVQIGAGRHLDVEIKARVVRCFDVGGGSAGKGAAVVRKVGQVKDGVALVVGDGGKGNVRANARSGRGRRGGGH